MWILRLEYRKQVSGALFRGILFSALLLLFMILYHRFRLDILMASRALGGLPEELAALFGFREGFAFKSYLNVYDFLMVWLILYFAYYAACLGGDSLHGEEQRKSIFYILARPIARWQLVLYKMLLSSAAYLLAAGLPFLASCGFFWLLDGNTASRASYFLHLWNVYLGVLLTGFVFMAAGFLYSALAGKNGYAQDFGIAAVAGTTIAGLVPELFNLLLKVFILAGKNINKLQPLTGKLSYFNLLSPAGWANPLRNGGGSPDILAVGIGGLVILICLVLTFVIYHRKEFY